MSLVTSDFFLDSKSTWNALYDECSRAVATIDFERYIFNTDDIGRRFVDLFIEKARQGVRVRLIVDMVGSFYFWRSSWPLELQKKGVEVRFFNPISLWRIGTFTSNFFRDHRKLVIVDGRVGFVGGVGIDRKTENWRDTEVRFKGPIVALMTVAFERMWIAIARKKYGARRTPVMYVKRYALLTNSTRFGTRQIYHNLISAIKSAKKYIYLTTPYFIPDINFFHVLRQAGKRGVDVRLLVPESADYRFVDRSTESYFTLALKAGIKIYRYTGRMLHAKTGVIDDSWGTVGTLNLDNLSFFFNHEINVVSQDKDFVWNIKKQFLFDIQNASRVHYDTWIKRSFLQKLQELITWPFHNLF